MKVFALKSLLLSAVVVALSACSSSSDPVPAESGSDGAPSMPGEQMGDQPGSAPIDNPGDGTGDPVIEPTPENPVAVPGEEENPLPAPEPMPEPEPEPEPVETVDPEMLIPSVIKGSDLDRLLNGVKSQASRTILNLGQLLSEGALLTDQQNNCLGAYDPAFGESLLSVSCEQALATGDIALYVGEAAFYDTEACNNSVFEGSTVDCYLQRASITIPTTWIPQPSGPPKVDTSGFDISYAIDNTLLRLENLLNGANRCDIELSSGQASSPLTGQSCTDIIRTAADRIEALLAN